MAANVTKSPAHPHPLMDDPGVSETFADSVVGITMNQGNVNITLAAIRGDHTQVPPKNYRHVNARLVLPLSAVMELHAVLGQC